MAGNGGIIGPTKVVNTPQTRTETFTDSGSFQKTNCTSTIPEVLVVAGGGAGGGDASGNCGSSGGGGAGGGNGGYNVGNDGGSGYIGETFIEATGGTITTACTNFRVHTFTGPGTFTVCSVGSTAALNKVSYMVVAGGGGGGYDGGGGGGAGGYREGKNTPIDSYTASPLAAADSGLTVTATSYSITVGGGSASTTSATCTSQGGPSTFSSITSAGGGGGGAVRS